MKKIFTLLLIFSIFSLSFAGYKVVLTKSLNEQKLIELKNKFDFPTKIDDSKEIPQLVISYVFKYRLEAVITENLLRNKYFNLYLDPCIEDSQEESTPDAMFKVLGYPFEKGDAHSSILYPPQEKVDEIDGKFESCKKGALSLKNLIEYVKALPEENGIKAYGYCRLAYFYIDKDRAKSAEIFKRIANSDIEVSEYDRVDAMMQYARALHYYKYKRHLFYNKKYAFNSYKSFWIYKFVEKYIQNSPFKNELETKVNGELYKELVSIMLERAKIRVEPKEVPFEEVRKYVDEVLEKVKDTDAKDYLILMKAESYYFAKDTEKFLEEGKKILSEKMIKRDTLPWLMLLNMMGYAFDQIGEKDEAIKCFKEVINSPCKADFMGTRLKFVALERLSYIYRTKHEEDKARPYIKKYAKDFPEVMKFFPYNLDTDPVYMIIEELNKRSFERVSKKYMKKLKSMGCGIE